MDKLKCLSEKEVLANIDIEEAKRKKILIEKNLNLYIKIQGLYKKIFDNYIEKLISINSIVDKALIDSNLDYGKIKDNQKNEYHKFSYLNSDYLFVRNFFYIERLEKKDIEKFKKKIENNDFEINDELEEIVKQTYSNIIRVDSDKGEKHFKTVYGYAVPNFFFDNDSLVLFLNYGKNTKKLKNEEFIKNKIEKEKNLDKLIILIKSIFENKLGYKTEIRYYKGII